MLRQYRRQHINPTDGVRFINFYFPLPGWADGEIKLVGGGGSYYDEPVAPCDRARLFGALMWDIRHLGPALWKEKKTKK